MSYKAMADAHQLGAEIRNFLKRNKDDNAAIDELQVEIQEAYFEEHGTILKKVWQAERQWHYE